MTLLTFWILGKTPWQRAVMLPLLAQRGQPLLVSSEGYLTKHIKNVFCDVCEVVLIKREQLRTDIIKAYQSYGFQRLDGAAACHLSNIFTLEALERFLHSRVCRNGETSIFPLYDHVCDTCCLSHIFCKRREVPLYSCLQRNYGKFCSIAIKSTKNLVVVRGLPSLNGTSVIMRSFPSLTITRLGRFVVFSSMFLVFRRINRN